MFNFSYNIVPLDHIADLKLIFLYYMKGTTAFLPNKKLILHFDVDEVIKLSTKGDKDLFIYELCASWVWGKLQKNSKENPDKVTGWKIALNTLSQESPQLELISYKSYLQEYIQPSKEQYEKLLLNLSKGPASKAKSEIQKNIKNISLPKTLAQAIKETADPNNKLLSYFNTTGKYLIMPAFYKLLLTLKKLKRQFAVIIENNNIKDNHFQIINELNLFFGGQHPLYNGKNGTPSVKWDGSKGAKNFIIQEGHQVVYYKLGEGQIASTFGTLNIAEQKDTEMFKQRFKSYKSVKLCQGVEQIYSVSHSILAESASVYQVNPHHIVIIDPVDYLTHEMYFTNSDNNHVYSCLGEEITEKRNFVVKVNLFDYLKDIDYFIKVIQILQGQRSKQIQRIEKGQTQQNQQQQDETVVPQQIQKQSNHQYLKKHLLPVLEGALKQVDLFRPEDPIGFIALYCLKNKDRLQ